MCYLWQGYGHNAFDALKGSLCRQLLYVLEQGYHLNLQLWCCVVSSGSRVRCVCSSLCSGSHACGCRHISGHPAVRHRDSVWALCAGHHDWWRRHAHAAGERQVRHTSGCLLAWQMVFICIAIVFAFRYTVQTTTKEINEMKIIEYEYAKKIVVTYFTPKSTDRNIFCRKKIKRLKIIF